jgi:hypothetical protein
MEVAELADWPSFPFCSAKCRLIDLGRWLGQDYRIPAGPESAEEVSDSDEETVP